MQQASPSLHHWQPAHHVACPRANHVLYHHSRGKCYAAQSGIRSVRKISRYFMHLNLSFRWVKDHSIVHLGCRGHAGCSRMWVSLGTIDCGLAVIIWCRSEFHWAGIGTTCTNEKHFVIADGLEVHRMKQLPVDMSQVILRGGLDGIVCSVNGSGHPRELSCL